MTFREGRLVGVFVSIADTLVQDFDVVDLFHELVGSCSDLLGAAGAGLLLRDSSGSLRVAAATSEGAHLVELLELQKEGGPGAEAYHLGEPSYWVATTATGTDDDPRWQPFAEAARSAGFTGATAVPMRLRDNVLGALTVFQGGKGRLSHEDLVVAQALADLAAIAILQDRSAIDDRSVINQLQTALDTRIVIEQAKGVVAQETGLPMDEAFALIRGFARDHNRRLRIVAEQIASGLLEPERLSSKR